MSRIKLPGFALLLGLGLLAPWAAMAQDHHSHATCATDEYNASLFESEADFQAAMQAATKRAKQRIENGQLSAAKTNKTSGGATYVIPTVVHVIFENTSDSIPLSQIEGAMTALWRDFRRVPFSFGYGSGVDMDIEFQLANLDTAGNPTTGVLYHYDTNHVVLDRSSGEDRIMKPKYNWDPTKYFNIWVVREISGGSSGTVLGYATFPFSFPNRGTPSGADSLDGIVVRSDNFSNAPGASTGGYGRTVTHEVGHWVGLFHPFQGSCGNNCSNSGDFICDTPPTFDSESNRDQNNLRNNTCRDNTGPLNRDMPDHPQLYMDYSAGDFQNKFTPQQRDLAQSYLTDPLYGRRYNLWQESNLQATGVGKYGAPIAWFEASKRNACVGTNVTLLDFSRNQPTSYKWEVPGATFVTPDTSENPIVTFSQAGSYDVTLIVSNLSGNSDTLTKTAYLAVSDTIYNLPFYEGFETSRSNFPPDDWHLVNEDISEELPFVTGKVTWGPSVSFGGFDTSQNAALLRFGQYPDYGQRDELVLPAMDFSDLDSAALVYSIAYQSLQFGQANAIPYRAFYEDTLEVYASRDCGETWDLIYDSYGRDLATAPVQQALTQNNLELFTPGPNEWRRDSLNLNTYAGESNVRLKFVGINGFGNQLYIDDVEVLPDVNVFVPDTTPTDTDSTISRVGAVQSDFAYLELAPNPAGQYTNLHLELQWPASVRLEVLDLSGRLLRKQELGKLVDGEHTHRLDLDQLPAGAYLLRLRVNETALLKRLIKQ